MAQPSKSLFRRIRSVKSSLDNAEQSFLDNKDIRGELDLMLAEAELKNLRKKKDVPWSWNRQLFAVCAAVMLVLAGVGGWYFARGHYKQRAKAVVPPVPNNVEVAKSSVTSAEANLKQQGAASAGAKETQKSPGKELAQEKEQSQVSISKADLHKLVQSARVELSNSK
ncbi:MAG: hypothetical protein ACI3XC_07215 [Phascolarctobacterium sp.]